MPLPERTFPFTSEIDDLSMTWNQADGSRKMTTLREAALLSRTPAKEGQESEAPMSLNAHSPSWLPR